MSQLPQQPTTQAMQDALAQQQAEINQQPAAPVAPSNPLAFLQGAGIQPAQPAPVAAAPQVATPQPVYAQPAPVAVAEQPAQAAQPAQVQPAQVPAVQQSVSTAIAIAVNQAPDWLVEVGKDAPMGLETVSSMLLPPKLMIRQGMTNSDEVRTQFQEGQIYLAPDLRRLWTVGEAPIRFTPILCFSEWTLNNPNGMKPFVVERTSDPNHRIARASRNADTRRQAIPGTQDPKNPREPLYRTAVEHLTYLVMLHIENGPMMPVLLDFSKTGLLYGKSFNNLIVARGQHIYAGVYELQTDKTTNAEGTFYNYKVTNPMPGTQWVSPDQFAMFKDLHTQLAEKRKAGEIGDIDDDGEADPVAHQQPAVNYGPPQGQQVQYPPQQGQPPIVGYDQRTGQPIYAQPAYAPPVQQPVYGHVQPVADPNAAFAQAAAAAQQGYRGI